MSQGTNTSKATPRWILNFRPNPAASWRLFCFPFAGGAASAFRLWANQAPNSIEVLAIQPPGRENRLREPRIEDLDLYVEAVLSDLLPCMDRPFAFFGHSLGGLVSFELARTLRSRYSTSPSLHPQHLFISGRRAPHLPTSTTPMHELPEAQFVDEMQRRYNGIPAIILKEPELLSLFIPILRSDMAVFERYRYREEPPLHIPITTFGGTMDPVASESDIRLWKEHTSQAFALHMMHGDHFFINYARDIILDRIAHSLE